MHKLDKEISTDEFTFIVVTECLGFLYAEIYVTTSTKEGVASLEMIRYPFQSCQCFHINHQMLCIVCL